MTLDYVCETKFDSPLNPNNLDHWINTDVHIGRGSLLEPEPTKSDLGFTDCFVFSDMLYSQ